MKAKFNIKLLTFVLLAGLLTGCEGFLEQIPKLSQSDALTLSTYAGLKSATQGAYAPLTSVNWYGAYMIIAGDLKGGNAKRGPADSGRYTLEYLWANSKTNTSSTWITAYYTIACANNVINKIDGGFSEANVTEAQLGQLKGECLFLRALGYFDLVRMYAQPYVAGRDNMGVPVVLVTENGYPARNTVGEVYDQIISDLEDAQDLMAEDNAVNDGLFANSYAAKALLAKVNLYMGNWQAAADAATEVIDGGKYTLFTVDDYTTYADGGYWGGDGEGSEIIFWVIGEASNTYDPYWESIAYLTNPDGYGDVCTGEDLLDLYGAGDVRADLFNEPTEPAEYAGFKWTLKYPGRLGATPTREFNVPVLRLSEMYLIRAEAILNGATITGVAAVDDYNEIRTNRGLVSVVSCTITDIYAERRRELCFEGNELFDLARTQRSLVRGDDYTGLSNKNVTFTPGGTATENYLWAYPIPQREIDSNENVIQNPGY
jgi:starch-binding outer membrane protein, SusD/RagB family